MPPQTISLRPQTSRQARRAYQKAGGTPRLSEVEQRRLERSAELEERAARIRAHNARSRENKRKRAEKLEKERETRRRMGISEPTKIKISPSQLSLGNFVKYRTNMRGKEAHSSSKTYVKEETTESVPRTCPNPAYCSSNNDSPEQPILEEQQLKNPTSPSQRLVPHHIVPSSSRGKKASSESLMPPPLFRAPLRKTSVNQMTRPCSKPQKDDLSAMIGNDWDSLFDSNTQVEREISSYNEQPPAPYQPSKVAPSALLNPPPMAPSDLLASISTQDLQYSSSPPSPAKDHSDEVSNLSDEHRSKLPTKCLARSEESTITLQKRRPTSLLRPNELDMIMAALWNMYCLRLSLPDIRRLISGQRLDGDAGIIPPRLVILMAIKVEEERKPGKPPPVPIVLMQWASSMQEIEAQGDKLAASARVEMDSHLLNTVSSCNIAAPGPRATDLQPVAMNDRITTSKSLDEFDEFDGFELSTQDLCEFDV
ncbi:MAG: hypothetical protein Q9211_003317 [Gyalolechia sp. 1 TL-2023]